MSCSKGAEGVRLGRRTTIQTLWWRCKCAPIKGMRERAVSREGRIDVQGQKIIGRAEQLRPRTRQRLAVLVPCFNEEGAIAKVVADFCCSLPEAAIYVYDNNSTDGRAEPNACARRSLEANRAPQAMRSQATDPAVVRGQSPSPGGTAPRQVTLSAPRP